jgi:pyruvate-ferredoxin/flavodoxin oxidoreductase
VARFASSGKKTCKKNLAAMAMTYEYIYVATVAMGANKMQMLRAFTEAEKYPGPSLIICYCPCINQGLRKGMGTSQEEEKRAVQSGYWPLFRFNPALENEGKNPFILDSKDPDGTLQEFLSGENRYLSLEKTLPEESKRLRSAIEGDYRKRFEEMKALTAASPKSWGLKLEIPPSPAEDVEALPHVVQTVTAEHARLHHEDEPFNDGRAEK